MTASISIAGVSERDIDLLLLEEFQSTPSFQEWFVGQIFGPDRKLGKCIAANRSVTDFTGESDLEVVFMDQDNFQTKLMIENKVNAGLQPLQAQRYIERGEGHLASGKCSAFHTIIIAPRRYYGPTDGSKGFGSRLTYEEVLGWFEQASFLGDRRNYKIALLKSAIDKGTLGYQPEIDGPTTNFWYSYWQLACQRAPDLEMKEPKEKPSGSGFVHFRPPKLPRGVDIVHKLNFGYVDLHLRGMGKRINEVRSVLGPFMNEDMVFAPAAKSAAIRVEVPKLKASQGMLQQEELAAVGVDAAKRLLEWFLAHKETWRLHVESH